MEGVRAGTAPRSSSGPFSVRDACYVFPGRNLDPRTLVGIIRGDPDIVHPVRPRRRLGRRSRRDQANDRLVRAVEGVIPPGVGPLGMLTEPAVRSGEMPADSYGRVESVGCV